MAFENQNSGESNSAAQPMTADENVRLLRSCKVYNTINSLSGVVPSNVPEALSSSNAEE